MFCLVAINLNTATVIKANEPTIWVIKVKYNLTKVIAKNKTGVMIPEVGVKFVFIDRNGNTVQELTTDNEGKISVELPFGTYTVRQLTATQGHEKVEDYTIKDKDGNNVSAGEKRIYAPNVI